MQHRTKGYMSPPHHG